MASKFLLMIFPLALNTFWTLILHICLLTIFSSLLIFMQVKKQSQSSALNLENYTVAISSPAG